MFKIGEFGQIARVSGRQLRHYDRLGLLEPEHTDPQTGYRYYTARQLPRLNRLLALKALGFSLEQIGPLLDDAVPAEELRGMLAMRKAQAERTLAEQQATLRQIEARILQIEEQGSIADYDVTVRTEPAHPYMSLRKACRGVGEAVELVELVARQGMRRLPEQQRDTLTIVAHSDFDDEELDLEIGFTMTQTGAAPLRLPGDLAMTTRELEAVPVMATVVRTGTPEQSHLAYGALGVWLEANDYAIDGRGREILLDMPLFDPSRQDVVMEIQFPVRKTA